MRSLLAVLSLALLIYQQSITVDVHLEEFVATVRDRQDRIIDSLSINDFVLEENGKKQRIAHFIRGSDTPASVAVLIDTSGSMSRILPAAVSTAKALVHLMRADDEFIVMTFDDTLHVEQGFSRDRSAIDTQLSEVVVNPKGGTSLFESLFPAIERLRQSELRKRAILVVTDGLPSKRPDFKKTRNAIYSAETLIYTFGFLQPPSRLATVAARQEDLPQVGIRNPVTTPETTFDINNSAKEILELLATASGGQSLALDPAALREAETVKQLITFVQQMAAELHGQYMIGYYPADKKAPNAKVTIKTVSGNYRVRVRVNS